ncbi:MAG: hypothetical protein KG003_15345 [Bacteroidetes bacterium]|nr:hypothetical protein [Bacteroidota bacterium]
MKSKNNINKESYYSDIYEFDLHKNNLVKITQQLPNNSRDVYRTERNDFKFVRLDSITFKKLFDSLKLVMVLQKNVDIQFRDFPFSDSHFITQNIFLNVRNGKQVSFQEGKFRVIDFSFLACGPCWINFRKLDTLHSEFPDLEICIIDPNYTKSDLPIIEDKLPGFIYTEPKNPNIVLDNLQQYPFTILLNPQNQIVYSHYGKLSQPAIYEIRQLLRSD